MANSYCDYIVSGRAHPVSVEYHDLEYGFSVSEDDVLFERLILEIYQAGLSWEGILKRRQGLRDAYAQFDPNVVAAYTEENIAEILANPLVIRNRLKAVATIYNANAVLKLQSEFGSFRAWLDSLPSASVDEWVKQFRTKFKFIGPEIVREFLTSIGFLPGAHDETCPAYAKALATNPRWAAERTP